MALPTIFDVCTPRDDIKKGSVQDTDFAADLAMVLRGDAPEDYKDPAKFFANTHPTRGLKNLLSSVNARLAGHGDQVAAIFRLDTQFGGGKTHSLIALAHAAKSMKTVPNAEEFIDSAKLPKEAVRVFGFEGENADPANGRELEKGVRAFTPWGELAYALGKKKGYETVRRSDEECVAPGAETLRGLLEGGPALLLLDELGVYFRKLKGKHRERAGDQLGAFLSSLFQAVEGTKDAALVYTLAIGKGGIATDAYGPENQYIADKMAELESISARKATLLNPTEDDETVLVLRRRLFSKIDEKKAAEVVATYRAVWEANRDSLPPAAIRPEQVEALKTGYPLHPELMTLFTNKMSTLQNFQRVRGMLRFLARTVALLWKEKSAHTFAIHVHHLNPSVEAIRQEVVTKLGQSQYVPAIKSDVAGDAQKPSLAEQLDRQHYAGMPPFGSFVARNVLFHTLAFNESLKGIQPAELRFSILAPELELGFIEDARKKFIASSAYLDDRPGAPLRFLAEANLTQMVKREEQQVDKAAVRSQLRDRIKSIFGEAGTFHLVPFPAGPHDVPEDMGDNRPLLVLLGYEALDVASEVESVPELVEKIFAYKGAQNDLRKARNNLVFLVADAARIEDMKAQMARRLALDELRRSERLQELAEHQRDKVQEWHRRSEQEVAIGIQQCYRHLFYPSRNRLAGTELDIAHAAIDVQSASERPGAGQQQVVRTLRDGQKLRVSNDSPDAPTYVRDRTPLKKGQISTAALREEFRRDPTLPMLSGDDVFVAGIRRGIEDGEYVYKSGDLLLGKGDPFAEIKVDEQSVVFTMAYARENDIWPRPAPKPAASGDYEPPGEHPPTPLAYNAPPGGPQGGWPDAPPADAITAEGVLKEALTQVWEKARKRKLTSLRKLSLRLYDGADVFKLLGAIASVPGATKTVNLTGGYTTANDGTITLEVKGPVEDAKPVREFLEPQLRAAKETLLNGTYQLDFAEGLSMSGDQAEKLTEKLARLSSGAVSVVATAEG